VRKDYPISELEKATGLRNDLHWTYRLPTKENY